MGKDATIQLPPQASTFAPNVDNLYYFIYWVCVFFFVLIVGLMVWFVVKYRRKSEDEIPPHITHNTLLEVTWSVAPIFLLVIFFMWGFIDYMHMRVPPNDALTIYVTAEKWKWTFEYPNGVKSHNELTIPVDVPVKLVMTSKDVLHCFFVPSFRTKQDVVPNRYTTLWFEATRLTGKDPANKLQIFCAEYCGTGHSDMLADCYVVSKEDYEEFIQLGSWIDPATLPPEERGRLWFTRKLGCAVCHDVTGTQNLACPSLKGAWGTTRDVRAGGTTTKVKFDEEYVRESIMDPTAKVVSTYQAVMPNFAGQVTDDQIKDIIGYLKTLK
jgi:cytochrome c oxidase subunit 2